MEINERVKQLVHNGQRKEAIELLEQQLLLDGEQEDMLLLLGELIYTEGRMAEALNRFNAVLRLNPAHQKARNYVTMIDNILGYYCKDMFNP